MNVNKKENAATIGQTVKKIRYVTFDFILRKGVEDSLNKIVEIITFSVLSSDTKEQRFFHCKRSTAYFTIFTLFLSPEVPGFWSLKGFVGTTSICNCVLIEARSEPN